jgi:hypothetical protein
MVSDLWLLMAGALLSAYTIGCRNGREHESGEQCTTGSVLAGPGGWITRH